MNLVYKSKYVKLEYAAEKSLLTTTWFSASNELKDTAIKDELLKINEFTTKYKPKFKISDDRKRGFMYSIDIQQWVAKSLKNTYDEAGIEKFAILLPEDLINQISTEQTITEAKVSPERVKICTDIDDALVWIGLL